MSRQLIAALKTVAGVLPRKASRYAITGVLVDPIDADAVRLVATNGHALALCRVDGVRLDQPRLLGADTVKAMLRPRVRQVHLDPGGVHIDGVIHPWAQGQFPPYLEVIPRQVMPEAPLPLLSPSQLGQLLQGVGESVHALPTGPNRPVLFHSPAVPMWLGVIMPLPRPAQAWGPDEQAQAQVACGLDIRAVAPAASQPHPA